MTRSAAIAKESTQANQETGYGETKRWRGCCLKGLRQHGAHQCAATAKAKQEPDLCRFCLQPILDKLLDHTRISGDTAGEEHVDPTGSANEGAADHRLHRHEGRHRP